MIMGTNEYGMALIILELYGLPMAEMTTLLLSLAKDIFGKYVFLEKGN